MSIDYDIRAIARQLILDDAENYEFSGIGDHFYGDKDFEARPVDEQDAIIHEIDELMGQAIVTVILPGDPVCPGCSGTGQPSESDGTPKDLPQYEAVLDAIDTWLDNEDDSDGLATTIMGLFGAAQAESEAS